jgi:hypothetical protein
MNVKDFRKKIKPDSIIVIDGKEYKIETLIKFRFDDGSYYIKCYFSNGMVFAEDETENNYVFVEPVETEFGEPFPEKLNFQKKDYNFIYLLMLSRKWSQTINISKLVRERGSGTIKQTTEAISAWA